MRNDTGKQATWSQQRTLLQFVPVMCGCERVIIHHVTDGPRRMQLEIERRCPVHGIKFERVIYEN